MTWQKVQITVEAAAMADAAPSSRNGYSSSQRIFSPENMFWAHEAFIAEGQVRIIQVGWDLLDHQVQLSATVVHCTPKLLKCSGEAGRVGVGLFGSAEPCETIAVAWPIVGFETKAALWKSSCVTLVSWRAVRPVPVSTGKISLAAEVELEHMPDSPMSFPLPQPV